jgi:hypothetical protein
MSASFFALAFLAALNPKLLALDLLLIENRRPRAMFLCLLLGGLTVALAVGLVDVLSIHADAVKSQVKVGAGVDLGLGLFLLAAAGLLASGWRPRSQRPPPDPGENGQRQKKTGWAQRALAEPRLGLAMLVGALIGVPGASYLTGLHHLISSKTPAAIAVIAVVLFVFIEFLLIIIPFAFLEFRPEATKIRLKKTQDWLLTHARKLMATIALLLGAYLVINGAIRLS